MCRPNCRDWWSGIVAIHPDTVDIGAALVQAMEEATELTRYAFLGVHQDTGDVYFMVNGKRWCASGALFRAVSRQMVQDGQWAEEMHYGATHSKAEWTAQWERMMGHDGP